MRLILLKRGNEIWHSSASWVLKQQKLPRAVLFKKRLCFSSIVHLCTIVGNVTLNTQQSMLSLGDWERSQKPHSSWLLRSGCVHWGLELFLPKCTNKKMKRFFFQEQHSKSVSFPSLCNGSLMCSFPEALLFLCPEDLQFLTEFCSPQSSSSDSLARPLKWKTQ